MVPYQNIRTEHKLQCRMVLFLLILIIPLKAGVKEDLVSENQICQPKKCIHFENGKQDYNRYPVEEVKRSERTENHQLNYFEYYNQMRLL